ncbi:hypothetical protein C8Q70DRAFT_293901 [Cubamyces menziesii]|nr:hypothetical protein C8Q70DRAFT_293901 [Cubamyces menziesii]
MNGNTQFPLYDSVPDPSTDSPERSSPLHWFPSQYELALPSGEDYPHPDCQATSSVPNMFPPPIAHFQQYHQQETQLLEPPARDEVLSPLPLGGMQQLFEDRVTPPTPPVLEPFVHPTRSSHQFAFPTLTPAHTTGVLPTPSSTIPCDFGSINTTFPHPDPTDGGRHV